MRLLSTLCLILGLFSTSVIADSFPSFTSEALNGKTHTIPAEFPGDPTIVFIAYKRNQQPAVDSWVAALELDPDTGPEFVELPVVGTATKMIKSFVDNGMRSGITATSWRARTITLYESPRSINEPLGFSGRGNIRVLLVRPDGEVLWKTSGPATSKGVENLKAAYTSAVN